jgi:hypothetical protein
MNETKGKSTGVMKDGKKSTGAMNTGKIESDFS